MAPDKRALLLAGSPRYLSSTSESLGSYLMDRLAEKGVLCETRAVFSDMKDEKGRAALLSAVESADIVVLSCPLYVDSLPAQVIRALEMVARERGKTGKDPEQWFCAMVNCGFPESRHNDTALDTCRLFARQGGFRWAGGLGLGGGEAIRGRSLYSAWWLTINVRRALNLAAEALVRGRPLPEKAGELFSRPLVPKQLYLWLGGIRWARDARVQGGRGKLDDRPLGR
ncbi:MAG: NAD(P)H-dependent oxidoreductase [Desulfatibacillaceae bacterium]